MLPNQKKWLVVPRVSSSEQITSAKLNLKSLTWQKRLEVPKVEFKMSEPYIYEQVNPLSTITEGTIVNNSPYVVKQTSLVIVLYDNNNSVVAVSTREEYDLAPFERRAYKILWPGIYRQTISRVGLESYTNSLDPENLSSQANAGVSNLVDPE